MYVGSLEEPHRAAAESLFEILAERANDPVLVAVSPGQRVLDIVTGTESAARLPNRACALAALGMPASFSGGDLVGGIVNGLAYAGRLAGPDLAHRA